MNHFRRDGPVIMAVVIAARFMGMFLTLCKTTSRFQPECFSAENVEVFICSIRVPTTNFVHEPHNSFSEVLKQHRHHMHAVNGGK